MKLTAQQFQKATRAKYGLAPRPPKSEVPSITRRDYGYVLDRWARFDPFRSWRDRGGPKPANVWRRVPPWDGWTPWDLLEEIRDKYPLKHTEPPPPQPVPPTKPPFSLAPAQCWFIIAQEYQAAASGPGYFGRAFVADGAYQHPTREEVAAYRASGVRTATWGDSRPSGGTSTQQIVDLANELRVDRPIFQAELIHECRASMDMIDRLGGDGHIIVGNLSQMQTDGVLYAELVGRINRGNVLWQQELYKNCGQGGPDWKGLPVACSLGATYHDADCPGLDMDTYYANGWMAQHRDSWYTAQWDSGMYARAR